MPRRARSFKRRIPVPDSKYGSSRYAKFINYLMERGKKTVAEKIFYQALEEVEARIAKDPSVLSVKSGQVENNTRPMRVKKADSAKEDLGVDADKVVKTLSSVDIFDMALKNVCPILEVKGRRIGGSNYQVPMEVPEPRKTTLGMKWMINAARSRKGMPMHKKLALEILDAYNRLGAAYKKMEDVRRMAESNRAFAHFARFGQKRK